MGELARREHARYRGARPGATLQQAARDAHSANALQHEVQLLTAAAQQVMDAARSSQRPKYDGAKLIADGKRRRRELISAWARGGMNGL